MDNENDRVDENEKIKGINLENEVSKNILEGEESENEETTRKNKKERELLEIYRDRRIEVEKRERQQANKAGKIPKATIRSIETTSKPRNRDERDKETDIMNSTNRGMLSPNTEIQ